jgi:hypothetical protein
MLTVTESLDVGTVGIWPVTLTEIGGAEVFMTAIVSGKFNRQSIIRKE